MKGTPVAHRINLLPWQKWLSIEEFARELDAPVEEAERLIRAGRRRGSITVKRTGREPLFMRVTRHPLPSARARPAPRIPGRTVHLP
ncbi:hypothetical protein ACLQ2N_33065 [Streptomyces sp. DT224]|uniref:hypothetical protein n=1 Tax=Streptomyces sp. DT224 TaxID=3393426 RepID=UPI003CEFF160